MSGLGVTDERVEVRLTDKDEPDGRGEECRS